MTESIRLKWKAVILIHDKFKTHLINIFLEGVIKKSISDKF